MRERLRVNTGLNRFRCSADATGGHHDHSALHPFARAARSALQARNASARFIDFLRENAKLFLQDLDFVRNIVARWKGCRRNQSMEVALKTSSTDPVQTRTKTKTLRRVDRDFNRKFPLQHAVQLP